MILKKADIVHIVERIHKATGCKDLVLIGSGALIATGKALPASLMRTGEIDVYALDAVDPEDWETKVQIHFGQGSIFNETYKYYADPVSSETANLPDDWLDRAIKLGVKGNDDLTVTCPSSNDLAISKLCAWRNKDKDWLIECAKMRIVDLETMRSLSDSMTPPNGPGEEEINRRIDFILFELLSPKEKKARVAALENIQKTTAAQDSHHATDDRPSIQELAKTQSSPVAPSKSDEAAQNKTGNQDGKPKKTDKKAAGRDSFIKRS